jgi:hypothetical protein
VHTAPPVRVSLGRSAGWIVLVSLGVGIAAANFTAWVLLRNDQSAAMAAVLGLAASALMAWRLRRHQPTSDLNWNGAEWQWQGLSGQVQVALDFDGWMLLRFDPVDGRRRWIAASRRTAVGPWPALRAALHAPRPDDPLAAPPPSP